MICTPKVRHFWRCISVLPGDFYFGRNGTLRILGECGRRVANRIWYDGVIHRRLESDLKAGYSPMVKILTLEAYKQA